MGKYGVNVPKGVAVSSLDEVKNAIQQVFPNETEVLLCLLKFDSFHSVVMPLPHWIVCYIHSW